jgi:nucleoside-diphosphate-sugar epimerase
MDLRGAAVAVTGATGFLGRYIVDVLLGRGARVTGVVRNPARVPGLAARGVALRQADLAEPERLAQGFAGAAAVVSNAALLSLGNRSWDAHQRTNVEGTRNVFEAARRTGVRRIVHVSSVAGYRPEAGRPIDEDHPQYDESSPRTFTNAYAISKAVSERLAWRLAAAHGLELTTLRPCAIYGAFDPNFTRVFRLLTTLPIGVLPLWTRLPLVYAGDVAEAVALALETPAAIGRAYNVTGEDRTLGEFARAWRAAGGRTGWVSVPVPLPLRWRYDHRRAEAELGWRNRPFVDALRETFAREAAG